MADHQAASQAMSDREKKVKAVYSSIETGLTLLGAIAVEDKLQENVRETLVRLGAAGIKGYSSLNLLIKLVYRFAKKWHEEV